MIRYHKLYRRSATSGRCEDCGQVDNHSNACHDAAPIRKIEELYDEIESRDRQLKEWYDKLTARDDDVAALALRNGELTEKCAALAQEIHDLRSHPGSFPICAETPCHDAWTAVKQSRRTGHEKDPTVCTCPPKVKCPVHPKHCDCKFLGIFVDGVCDQCGLHE
jgi:hypothetical protein